MPLNVPDYHLDPAHLHVGCEPPRAYLIPYHSPEAARAGRRGLADPAGYLP